VIATLVAVSLALAPADTAAVARADNLRLIGAALSGSPVQLGELFELVIRARIPGDHVVYFPPLLEPRDGLESASTARWTSEPAVGDSIDLTLVYPLRALAWGQAHVPQTAIVLRRAQPGETGEVSGGTEILPGVWEEITVAEAGVYSRRPIVPGAIEVTRPAAPSAPVSLAGVPVPMDVVGRGFGTPVIAFALAALLATSGLLLWGLIVAARTVREWTRRAHVKRSDPVPPREVALGELDSLLDLGLHHRGRMQEFYTHGASTSRRFLDAVDEAYDPSMTDREVVARVRGVERERSAPFGSVMLRSEEVRFGEGQPAPSEAEEDLRELRSWVARYLEENGSR